MPRALLAAALLVFAMLVLRVAAVESPTMGSDEYAYVGAARYAATPDLMYRMDPGMQALGNKAYPAFYALWSHVSPDRAELVGRIFNAGLFVLGSLLLFGIFSRIFDRESARLSALLYLALPFSFYSITLLPEVEFQVSVYLVCMVVSRAGARPGYPVLALAAALSALSFFIKPHAAALIAACGAFWFAIGVLDRSGPLWPRLLGSLARAAFYFLATGAVIRLVNAWLSTGATAGTGVVPSFYQSYLAQLFSGGSLLSSLATFLDYVLGHLWLLMAYFTPGLVAIAIAVYGLVRHGPGREESEVDSGRNRFALFVALLLASFLVMVAMFTASAASLSAGEQFRMHGRYLAALLPFLLGYSVWACGKPAHRAVAALALAALLSFGLVARGIYKLYPWDYPEAFAFFHPSARYWAFDGALGWPLWFVLMAGIACWFMAVRSRSPRTIFVVFSLAWMLAAHSQMWRWLDQQSATSHAAIEPARAIQAFLGPGKAGDGLVLTQDRYGPTSSFLMGLRTLQHVRSYPATHLVTRAELPSGLKWVVAPEAMRVDFDDETMLKFGSYKLFLLDSPKPSPVGR